MTSCRAAPQISEIRYTRQHVFPSEYSKILLHFQLILCQAYALQFFGKDKLNESKFREVFAEIMADYGTSRPFCLIGSGSLTRGADHSPPVALYFTKPTQYVQDTYAATGPNDRVLEVKPAHTLSSEDEHCVNNAAHKAASHVGAICTSLLLTYTSNDHD